MDAPYSTVFSKALLTAVFAGIIATLASMGFYLFFKESTGFPLSALINVSSLIFFINTLFLVLGFIYYGCIKAFRKGEIAYIVIFALLTLFLTLKASGIHRSDNPVVNTEFHLLLKGLYIIMGISAVALIPILFHNKRFEKYVL